jgi:hypothetical protein
MLWAESGRLAIVLPRTLTMSIGDAQLRHILAHELAHIVRRDHWGNLLSFFVTSLFWWNPTAWLARRELRVAAESCCDAMAINRLAGSRKAYAETLLAVVDFVTSNKPFQPTVAATFGGSRSLKRRIEMIANPNVRTSLSRSGLLLVVCGVVSLALAPARAQQEAPNTSGAATAGSERPGEPDEKEYWGFKTTITWPPGAKAKSFDASGDEAPGPGEKESSDARVDWLSFLSALNKTLPGAKAKNFDASKDRVGPGDAGMGSGRLPGAGGKTKGVDGSMGTGALAPGAKTESSPGAKAGTESDAPAKNIPTLLKELTVPTDGVLAEVLQVHLRPGPETDPGAVAFVLRMRMIRADGGDAPLDRKAVLAFLSHLKQWAENVAARGVNMTLESIQGDGVDFEIAGTLR